LTVYVCPFELRVERLMNRILLIAASAILFAGCTPAPVEQRPSASQQEIDAVQRNYAACLTSAAQKLDDGISDAATIARAMVPECHAEFMQYAELFARPMNPNARSIYWQEVSTGSVELDKATGIVLKWRSYQSNTQH
jgi:PBP1b-binding outer membrane lipoprotein LpoB